MGIWIWGMFESSWTNLRFNSVDGCSSNVVRWATTPLTAKGGTYCGIYANLLWRRTRTTIIWPDEPHFFSYLLSSFKTNIKIKQNYYHHALNISLLTCFNHHIALNIKFAIRINYGYFRVRHPGRELSKVSTNLSSNSDRKYSEEAQSSE